MKKYLLTAGLVALFFIGKINAQTADPAQPASSEKGAVLSPGQTAASPVTDSSGAIITPAKGEPVQQGQSQDIIAPPAGNSQPADDKKKPQTGGAS